jgi:CheY-like chemotaxis protein
LIIDNAMPMMSGIEVVLEIRQRQKEGIYPTSYKVVLLTGENINAMENLIIKKKNKETGLFDFILEKPLTAKVLRALLKTCLLK